MTNTGAELLKPDTAIPAHVPRELVVDFDIFDPPGGSEDPHRAWLSLRKGPDIQWTPRNGGHWILTRAEDIEFFWSNPDPFSNKTIEIPRGSKPMLLLPQESDPPEHAAYRSIINVFFNPRAIHPLEKEVRELAKTLIDGVYFMGECDFVRDFAQQLPITIFMRLVALPMSDREMMLGWADDAVRGKTAEARALAYASIEGYLTQKVAERRAKSDDDLMSRVIHSKVSGRPLTDAEMLSFCTILFFGGLDTVVSSLGFIAHFLATSDKHRRQLVEKPELIPSILNELLRRFPVTTNSRILARDYVYKGILFKEEDQVSLGAPLHGLDEAKWENPLEIDFNRKKTNELGTFGFGPHRCPGSFLARTEIRVFLQEWLARIPEFAIKPGERPVFKAGRNNTVNYLPLAWPVP